MGFLSLELNLSLLLKPLIACPPKPTKTPAFGPALRLGSTDWMVCHIFFNFTLKICHQVSWHLGMYLFNNPEIV